MSSDVDRSAAFAAIRSRFEQPLPVGMEHSGPDSHNLSQDERVRSTTYHPASADRQTKPRVISSSMRWTSRTPSPAPTRFSVLAEFDRVRSLEQAQGSRVLKLSRPPSHSRNGWDQWLPEHSGPHDLEIGIQPLSRVGEETSDAISSRFLDSPDFVLKPSHSGQATLRRQTSSLRIGSTETIPLPALVDKTSYLMDPDPEDLYRRMEYAQIQRGRPRIPRTLENDTVHHMSFGPIVHSRSTPPSPAPSQRHIHRNGSSHRVTNNGRRSVSTPPVVYKRYGTPCSDKTSTTAKSYPSGASYPAYAVEYVKRESVATPDSGYSGSNDSKISIPRSHQKTSVSFQPSRPPRIPQPLPSMPLSVDFGGDSQIDLRQNYRLSLTHGASQERPRPTSNQYPLAAMRQMHGGIMAQIDLREVRPTIHTRPPVTGRSPVQYFKVNGQSLLATTGNPQNERPHVVSRRASYSSVTGISPVAEVPSQHHYQYANPYPERHTLPRSVRPSVLKVDTCTRAPHLDGTLSGHSTCPTSPTGTLSSASRDLTMGQVISERKKVGDFRFVNTLDAASRPYTPDKFALDLVNSQKDAVKTRASSRRSVRSLASFGAISRHSDSELAINVQSPTPQKKVLRKAHPERGTWSSLDDEKMGPRTSINPAVARNIFHGIEPDLYMTDIPNATGSSGARGVVADDNDSRRSSIDPDGPGQTRAKDRPSLFRLLDCTLSSPAISGLSVELARVSHQIHGDPVDSTGEEKTKRNQASTTTPTVTIRTEPPFPDAHDLPAFTGSSAASAPSLRHERLEAPRTSRFLFVKMFRESRLFVRQSFVAGLGSAIGNHREQRGQERLSMPNPAPKIQSKTPPKRKGRFMSFGKSKKQEAMDQSSTSGSILMTADGSADTSEDPPMNNSSKRKSIHDLVNEVSLVGTEKTSAFHEDLPKNANGASKHNKDRPEPHKKTRRPSLLNLRWRSSSGNMKETAAA